MSNYLEVIALWSLVRLMVDDDHLNFLYGPLNGLKLIHEDDDGDDYDYGDDDDNGDDTLNFLYGLLNGHQ